MVNLIDEVKQHARVLHGQAQRCEVQAVARMRRLQEFKTLQPEQIALEVQRKHALTVHARELGFGSYPHLKRVLDGDSSGDVGTLFHRESGGAFFNIWSAHRDEAQQIREQHGGYLLGYRKQFVIVDRNFVQHAGSDPDDPDWQAIDRNWCCPRDWDAWRRLTLKCIQSRRARLAAG